MSQLKLAILIPSIGESSAFTLFKSIVDSLQSGNFLLRHQMQVLMLVSSCSKDHIEQYRLSHHTIYNTTKKYGASKARNKLARLSIAPYILFCDADSQISDKIEFPTAMNTLLCKLDFLSEKDVIIFNNTKKTLVRLSPFRFRLTEWNFLVSRQLFISSRGFPDKIGVGALNICQSGEAQFLFNIFYKSKVRFFEYPQIFVHPSLGSLNEYQELHNEGKLLTYNIGASYATLFNLIFNLSRLSIFHAACFALNTLFFLPLRCLINLLYLRVIQGRVQGALIALQEIVIARRKIVNLYDC